jgi:Biotin-protein ligase, N terminal
MSTHPTRPPLFRPRYNSGLTSEQVDAWALNDQSGTRSAVFIGMNNSFQVVFIVSLGLILTASAACRTRGDKNTILLFTGTGTSPQDVEAVETVLKRNHLDYSTVSSAHLNETTESQIRGYRFLIVLGGNFVDIGNGLSSSTTANIRNAVQNGLNYLGICAGAFFAGNSGYNGLNLTSGVRFSFYSAEARGIRKTALPIAVADAPTLDLYWEDGPQLTGWGAVVGKYPDGTPAIVEGTFGSGSVILTGVHPEAPESWRHGMNFATPASVDNAYAGQLIHAALNRGSLSHY